MDPDDNEKTAFSTPTGHFHFKRMPFRFKSAPATFQRAMTRILTGLQGIKCLVYLDVIIIFGRNWLDHNNKQQDVFKSLREFNLKIKPEKSNFLHKEIMFLGHIIGEDGIKPNPVKIKTVNAYPAPTNVKQLQTFLGLANYYRKFINNFSKIVSPITYLLKKDVPFLWTEECENAFTTLKTKLTTYPILQHPDFTKLFLLTVDGSGKALGAILSQGKVGQDLPVSYVSRILNKAEQNYSTIEKEPLVVVWGTKTFRSYLLGRHYFRS